jgi:hypothetical protein
MRVGRFGGYYSSVDLMAAGSYFGEAANYHTFQQPWGKFLSFLALPKIVFRANMLTTEKIVRITVAEKLIFLVVFRNSYIRASTSLCMLMRHRSNIYIRSTVFIEASPLFWDHRCKMRCMVCPHQHRPHRLFQPRLSAPGHCCWFFCFSQGHTSHDPLGSSQHLRLRHIQLS